MAALAVAAASRPPNDTVTGRAIARVIRANARSPMMSRSVVKLLVTAASLSCARPATRARTLAEAQPEVVDVSVAGGVSLEVLDWGGSGSPMVFLAGGGNSTPHDFDDFAPRFTNRHRVVGITRRGN